MKSRWGSKRESKARWSKLSVEGDGDRGSKEAESGRKSGGGCDHVGIVSVVGLSLDHNLSLLPLASVLDALGNAVKSSLDSSADVANSIADGLSSAAGR